MRLRTEVRGKDGGKYVVGAPEDHTHTELAAHALLQAMDEFESGNSYDGHSNEDMRKRADELMREWLGKQDEVK